LDKKAKWQDDILFLPPVKIENIPINEPTGGWTLLEKPQKKDVHLPATIEGKMWGENGSTYGVTGNYVGVSWFSTKTNIPATWTGKRIFIHFESIRFRAEIFINRKMAGYDLVNSTPFDVDITKFIIPGAENTVDIRITDPNGNFNWKDSQCYHWGKYLVNPSHGFGGITGKVFLIKTDNIYIKDLYIENRPNIHSVNVHVETSASSKNPIPLTLEIREKNTGKIVYTYKCKFEGNKMNQEKIYNIDLPHAKLWSTESPNLYILSVKLGNDELEKHFGFRWFEIRNVNGDKQFYLNGKRIVLRTAISWSFWPDNGITPSKELAYKQVRIAKQLGLNMLNFHRSIGNTDVLNAADELGLLYFEEPGGNQYPANKFDDGSLYTKFYFGYRNEKLSRMILRDRSHPSLIIYNLHNERGADPQAEDYREMRMAHKLDPARILTYNSCNGQNPENIPNKHFKLHLVPNDTTFYDKGWWDNHHAGGPGVYHDNIYQGKDNYLRFSNNKNEIVYWGEEGAIGTPPRLQLIRDEILKNKKTKGWEADDYLKWYDAYDSFLKEKGFNKAFPCVDSLTRKMGDVAYYYQGRVIENIRICNTVDAYAINGWESMKLENHSGIVDNYRNPKGNTENIAYYNRPLYLAVKLNHKVLSVKDTTTTDIYIVNEKNIRGNCILRISASFPSGKKVCLMQKKVKISGDSTYGENLTFGIPVIAKEEGYTQIEATLFQNGKKITSGHDEFYAVIANAKGISRNGLVADTTGVINNYLRSLGLELKDYERGTPNGDFMIVGAFEPTQFGSGISDIMEWVYSGHTLVIVDNPETWADFLCDKEVFDYRGSKKLGTSWYGGNFFNRSHPIFEGLPSNCVFNWEYQCFAAYNRRRIGLRDFSGNVLVGCVSDHRKEIYSAMSEIKAGRGSIIITTLDIPSCLKGIKRYDRPVDFDGMDESMNTFNNKGANKANIVGQRLLLNMLRYASSNH